MLGEVLLAKSKSLSGAEQKSILSEALQLTDDALQIERQIAGQQLTIEAEQTRSRQLLLFSILTIAIIALLIVVVLLIGYRKRAIEEAARYKEWQYTILTHDLTNPMVAQQQVLRMLYRDFGFYTAEQTHALRTTPLR